MPDDDARSQRLYTRIATSVDADGRRPLPRYVDWDVFPFEGDLKVKRIDPPVLPEPPREGDPGGEPCTSCARGDDDAVWSDDRWTLHPYPEPNGLPTLLVLGSREHLDLPDLDDDAAADFGTPRAEWEANARQVAVALAATHGGTLGP